MIAGNGVSEDGKSDRDGRTFASALVKTLPRCGPVAHVLSPGRTVP
jgi:hypothetical protein